MSGSDVDPLEIKQTDIEINDDENKLNEEKKEKIAAENQDISTAFWERFKYFKISFKRSIHQFFHPTQYLIQRGLNLLAIEELLMLFPMTKNDFCVLIDEFLRLCGVDIFDEEQNEATITTITFSHFIQNCVYIKYHPFKARIATLWKTDLSQKKTLNVMVNNDFDVTFNDFCQCLSVFAAETPRAAKIRFAFRIYDMEDDNTISRDNLKCVLRLIIGEKFNDDAIESIVLKTFEKLTLNKDGNIDYHEFNSVVGVGDIASKYTIQF